MITFKQGDIMTHLFNASYYYGF